MKAYLISDNIDTATGMRLAGIEGMVVHEEDELKSALSSVLQMKDVSVVFVTELLSTKFQSVVANFKLNYKQPLILEIPDRHGSRKRADFITSYINEAIGVKIDQVPQE
ncbi:MAG: V-type ATP synthase subunit F [Lachnospiraceae bacterium]|nr:V-type ATP synthase subunit F [Lachnospiraceae bacterium]